jgi:hypothetical protein
VLDAEGVERAHSRPQHGRRHALSRSITERVRNVLCGLHACRLHTTRCSNEPTDDPSVDETRVATAMAAIPVKSGVRG